MPETPSDIVTERLILGICLTDPESLLTITSQLRPRDFYSVANNQIYYAILQLLERGDGVNRVTVGNKLMESNALQAVGGMSYIVSLDDNMPTIVEATTQTYIKTLQDKSKRRILLRMADEIIDRVTSPGATVKDAVEFASGAVFEASKEILPTFPQTIAEFIETYPGGGSRLMGQGDPPPRWDFGFSDLDWMTGGIGQGEALVIGGPPGSGKSALMTQMARNFADRGEPVIIYSMEMPKLRIFNRMMCGEAGISVRRFQKRDLSEFENQAIQRAITYVNDLPIVFDDTPALTPAKLSVHLDSQLSRYPNIACIFIDFIQLMQSNSSRHNDSERIRYVMNELQAIRKETGIPMVIFSQLNREPMRSKRKPSISDLFGSSAIEQLTDMVMFLYRDSESKNGVVDWLLLKNRDGDTGTIKMEFLGFRQTFRERLNDGIGSRTWEGTVEEETSSASETPE